MLKLNKTKEPKHIIRTYSAGVFYGRVRERSGQEVIIDEARRIWSWKGANTLSEVALHGVNPESRLSEPVTVLVLQVIEIIECTPEAEAAMDALGWGND